MGDTYGQASFLQIEAPELNDRILADFLDIESNILVTLHIHSIDQTKAIKTIKRKITDLDKSKIEEQKKAVRSGYDMDIIPTDLATYGDDAKKLLQDLQSHNERYFLMTPIIVNVAESMQQLKNNVFQTSSIAQKHNCSLMRLDYQQEEGLMSSLPLGVNQIEIQRGLTTSSTAIFVPFTTQELFQTGKEALYYLTPAPYVMDVLKHQQERQNEWKREAGAAWSNPGRLVFTNELGSNLSAQTVYLHFKKLAAEIDCPEARFHDLRHSYAVAALRGGDDIKTVQENLGHHTAAFTLDVYAHVTAQMKTESANRMQSFISSII